MGQESARDLRALHQHGGMGFTVSGQNGDPGKRGTLNY